jgi:potassium-transporting ATPase potassium-binding subunit
MTVIGWLQIALFAAIIALITRPLGGSLARVYAGGRTVFFQIFGPVETTLYRLAGINPEAEQRWYQYATAFLLFHLLGTAALYALLRSQSWLPLNPEKMPAVAPDLALNTAVSFVTNTSWQSYSGETTLSYASQMAGIAVQSFRKSNAAFEPGRGGADFRSRRGSDQLLWPHDRLRAAPALALGPIVEHLKLLSGFTF